MAEKPYAADAELAARVVAFLNELLECDRPAVAALIANRIPCNARLANHPSVQVAAQHGGYHVGLLGILNGLCGVREDNYGLIAAVFEDVDSPTKHRDLARFEVLQTRESEDMKSITSPEVPKNETTTVHHLKHGKTACPFSEEHGAPPAAWPRGHSWSQRWQDVTCEECLKAKDAG
jgi:hypothetical protein